MSERKLPRGTIRLNKGKGVLIEIQYARFDEWNNTYDYWVTEIGEDQSYWLQEVSMGPPMKPMEIVAWAAK